MKKFKLLYLGLLTITVSSLPWLSFASGGGAIGGGTGGGGGGSAIVQQMKLFPSHGGDMGGGAIVLRGPGGGGGGIGTLASFGVSDLDALIDHDGLILDAGSLKQGATLEQNGYYYSVEVDSGLELIVVSPNRFSEALTINGYELIRGPSGTGGISR
jgi:hypothetical protein